MSVRIERYVQTIAVSDNATPLAALSPNTHPVLSSIYQARGIQSAEELNYALSGLLPFHQLHEICL